jgi:RNA polymerase sigma-70 factor (ECF subfamily)
MNADNASATVVSLFECWYPSLVRYACRATGSFALAEDLVQDTFMQLYRELRKGRTVNHPKAWTLCVLRRAIGKHVRTYERQGGPPQPLEVLDTLPAGPPADIPRDIQWDETAQLFSLLSPREEEVLLLRMEALKYREIGQRLGISANSVNTLLARALRKLQMATKNHRERQSASQNVEKSVRRTLQ